MKQILVTGGAGYIGSHTCIELLNEGYEVVIIDNFYNSSEKVLKIIEELSGKKFKFYKGDIRDKEILRKIFSENDIYGVIHFAGLKAVGESVEKPIEYYDNNINGSIKLIEVMREFNVKNIIFSSSATVYGKPKSVPIKEDFSLSVTNPYGRTKLFLEEIFTDLYISDNEWNVILLRYFNPIGAHKSGRIGENPNGIPNNLVPYITQVAVGKLDYVRVFGDDYETKDGTGVRDYIHVLDLAQAHVKGFDYLFTDSSTSQIFNLGTEHGYTVKEIYNTAEQILYQKIPYEIVARRAGDPASVLANASKAKEFLNWQAFYSLKDIILSDYNWRMKAGNSLVD